MDTLKSIIDILQSVIDVVVAPIIAALAWLISKYIKFVRADVADKIEINNRFLALEREVMPKDTTNPIVKEAQLRDAVARVTVTFTHQHDEIQREFRGKVDTIEEDMKEVKAYMLADQKHKIDLSATLGGILAEMKHLRKNSE